MVDLTAVHTGLDGLLHTANENKENIFPQNKIRNIGINKIK